MSTPPQALLDKIKQLPPQRMAEVGGIGFAAGIATTEDFY